MLRRCALRAASTFFILLNGIFMGVYDYEDFWKGTESKRSITAAFCYSLLLYFIIDCYGLDHIQKYCQGHYYLR